MLTAAGQSTIAIGIRALCDLELTLGRLDAELVPQHEFLELRDGEAYVAKDSHAFLYLRLHGPVEARDQRKPLLRFSIHRDGAWLRHVNLSIIDFTDIWIYENLIVFVGWLPRKDLARVHLRYPSLGPSPSGADLREIEGNRPALLLRGSPCYYFPPGLRGGTKGDNLFCLPGDLATMRTLA